MTFSTRSRLRSILGACAGNLVEWYDWYAYSALTLYFAPAFFPGDDPTAQLLNAAAIFAVGFLMRPIGGWLLGTFADTRGRRVAMMLSVSMMCGGSLMVALAPTYDQVGVASAAWLVLARMIQGLSVGGEYGTSATYLSEVATADRRGFFSSFQYVTLIGGQLLALGVLIVLQFILSDAQLYDWGWRIPFAIGALAAVIVFYLRRNMQESEAFATSPRRSALEVLRLLARHPRAVATVVGLTLGGTVAFYTYSTYTQKFLVNTAGFTKTEATLIVSGALLVFMLLQPVFGLLSDRIGRKPLLVGFGVLGSALTVPLLTAIGSAADMLSAFLLVLGALVIVSGYTSINAVVKAELFPTAIRALGVGLPYALTVSIFGGTAEYVALWFKSSGREAWFFYYVAACIAVSLLVYLWMRDTRGTDLR